MNTQANETSTLSAQAKENILFATAFGGYYDSNKALTEAKETRETCRQFLEPIIKANKIAVGDLKAWKALQPEFTKAFSALEWPKDEDGEPREMDTLTELELKQWKSRVAAWLGVLRTCLEYQILPTDKNADRLRKAKVWTGLNGNGKTNPNWKPKEEPAKQETVSTPTAPALNPVLSAADAEKIVDKQIAAMDKAETKKAAAALDKLENVLDAATMTPSKGTTPQNPAAKAEIPRANVSNSDAPIPAREHCGILLDQLFKNESFRSEYAPILALMLDVEKSTLTRCMVQARDALSRGAK
jgi:hypothetical protein